MKCSNMLIANQLYIKLLFIFMADVAGDIPGTSTILNVD